MNGTTTTLRIARALRPYLPFGILGVAVAVVIGLARPTTPVHADTYVDASGGTLTVSVTSYDPKKAYSPLCPSNREAPNFTAWLTSVPTVTLGNPSKIDFDLSVTYRACTSQKKYDFNAYAVTSGMFCPDVGHYASERGSDNWMANDCVKYIDSKPKDSEVNPSLGCAVSGNASADKGGNWKPPLQCTQSPFEKIRVKDGDGAPPDADTTLPIPHQSRNIFTVAKGATSSGNGEYKGNVCQWYKHAGKNEGHCVDVGIKYSWTYTPPPSYSLSASLSNLPSNFAYYTTAPLDYGARVDASANLTDTNGNGTGDVGWHGLDLYRVIYPTKPTRVLDAGSLTSGDNGGCAAVAGTGYSECTRLAADGCPKLSQPYAGEAVCTNELSGTNQSWSRPHSEPDTAYPVGTYVCYFARISKPTHDAPGDQWKGSSMMCSLSGIKPKLQVWGGDVKAYGEIQTSTTLNPLVTKTYGSWGEYGVASVQKNILMGSGGGLAGGNPNAAQEFWSPLTFSNGGGGFGNLADVQAPSYYPGTPTEILPLTSGGCTLPARTYPAGSRAVIYCDGNLVISGNQSYQATVATIREIPNVKVVARKILIADTVTSIDTWLVARRVSDGSYGSIYTCYVTAPPAHVIDGITYNPSSTTCADQLTINAPVVAQSLYAFRTHDSLAGDPAEIFNLRANNILSSYVGGGIDEPVASTNTVTELPPRY